MAYTLNNDTDLEMTRYNEAARIKAYSGVSINNVRGGYVVSNPNRNTESVYIDLPSGGRMRVGDRLVTPKQMVETDAAVAADVPASEDIDTFSKNFKSNPSNIGGKDPSFDDYDMAGYSQAEILQYEKSRNEQYMAQPNILNAMKLTPDQMAQYAQQPGAEMIMPREASLREGVQGAIFNTLDPNREPTGVVGDTISSVLQSLIGEENLDPSGLRAFSGMFTDVLDVTTPGIGGAMSTDEGARMFNSGYELMKNGLASGDTNMMTTGLVDAAIGSALTTLGIVEFAPAVNSLTDPAKDLLRQASPTAKNMLADAIGASRAIAQGDKDMLMEIFQPAGTPRSLGAAAVGDRRFVLAPPTQEPSVGGLAPQYRVVVENFSPEGKGTQSFIPQQMTPQNRNVSDEKLTILANEFPDPLSSAEEYAGMMARVRNTKEVPAPPTWMIEHANDTDKWASWFKNLTPNQIQAADEGLSVQKQFRDAYAAPDTGPELTGQLMFWSIMSRMLSAFPHESGFLELAQSADPYIKKALAGEWTEQTTSEWRDMVSSTIPPDSPGRSATSNANAFGETFLRKMSVKDDAGKSALERLHDMIADPNMSSAQIRRGYYGLASETGIGNKILSFALLVSGRNDVVVLDRIQINRMWGGGEKIYDDIMKQFEGAQGLAQYEALERSLASRVGEVYAKAGRETEGNVGRYHWESWVLSSGQVVSHPTLESVVRAGTPNVPRDIPPTAATPVMEGRFHTKYSGVKYEKLPDGGNRYTYSTSSGQPYQFTKAQLDDMFDEAFKPKSGVLPPNFPGVKAFEGGNIPWYEFEGVDRGKLDDLIRKAGKPVR
jgi:hypothetical protein